LCSWARHYTLTVPLSTQVHKWVPANLMLGVTLRWTSIPSRGSRNIPSRFMLQKPGYAPAWWATWLICRLYLLLLVQLHLSRFCVSRNLSSLSFVIRVNLCHPWPSFFFYGFLICLLYFSILINDYFLVFWHFLH